MTNLTREERKAMWLARVSAKAGLSDNYEEIMREAREKFDKENPTDEAK